MFPHLSQILSCLMIHCLASVFSFRETGMCFVTWQTQGNCCTRYHRAAVVSRKKMTERQIGLHNENRLILNETFNGLKIRQRNQNSKSAVVGMHVRKSHQNVILSNITERFLWILQCALNKVTESLNNVSFKRGF